MDESKVILKGRLGPGMMITVDLLGGQVRTAIFSYLGHHTLNIDIFYLVMDVCSVICEYYIFRYLSNLEFSFYLVHCFVRPNVNHTLPLHLYLLPYLLILEFHLSSKDL